MKNKAEKNRIRLAAVAALGRTVPVMVCYLFMGIAAGLMLSSKGYGTAWSTFLAASTLSGTMQFMGVELLSSNAGLIYTALITLLVNFRYMFYGISMLGKFKQYKKIKPYMIFGLTDETYTLLYATSAPEGASEKWYMFFVAFFDHIYWIVGCTLGAAAGSFSLFDTTGIDFVMTALFVTIMLDQWKQKGGRLPALIGLIVTAVCLIILPGDYFIIASLAIIMLLLSVFRGKINELNMGESVGRDEPEGGTKEEADAWRQE